MSEAKRSESSEFKLREHVMKWKRSLNKAADPARIRNALILVTGSGSVFRIRNRSMCKTIEMSFSFFEKSMRNILKLRFFTFRPPYQQKEIVN
jgi:hypothetical protein